MKLKKFDMVLLGITAAAILFTAGYAAGRKGGGGVTVTVERSEAARTEQALPDTPEDGPDRISLNTATREMLMALPGVGETLADRIIEYRQEHPFETVEEVMDIQGVGETVFDNIKDMICV